MGKSYDLVTDARRPLYVPMSVVSDKPARLIVELEGEARRGPGLAEHLTQIRTVDVGPDERHASFVIGEDVPAKGPLRLRVTIVSVDEVSPRVLVHLPWAPTRGIPGPHWMAGGFEE
jgi:hypothetical protein